MRSWSRRSGRDRACRDRPDTGGLDASGTINGQSVTRPLCPYPHADATDTGGNPDQAASYTCRNQPHFTTPFLLNGQHG